MLGWLLIVGLASDCWVGFIVDFSLRFILPAVLHIDESGNVFETPAAAETYEGLWGFLLSFIVEVVC